MATSKNVYLHDPTVTNPIANQEVYEGKNKMAYITKENVRQELKKECGKFSVTKVVNCFNTSVGY